MIVYQLLNRKTGKSYIGQTNNFTKRQKQHLSTLRTNKHINPKLQRAFNKYSETHWTWLILDEPVEDENPDFVESFWIDLFNSFNNGYNLTSGGNDNLKRHPKKVCSRCQTEKPRRAFNKHRGRPDGFQRECRECQTGRIKDWYSRNREHHKETVKRYNRVPKTTSTLSPTPTKTVKGQKLC